MRLCSGRNNTFRVGYFILHSLSQDRTYVMTVELIWATWFCKSSRKSNGVNANIKISCRISLHFVILFLLQLVWYFLLLYFLKKLQLRLLSFCNNCRWRILCPIYLQGIISSSDCMIFFLWSEHFHHIKLEYKLCLGDLHRDLSGTNTVGTEGIYPQSLCLLSYSSHVHTFLIQYQQVWKLGILLLEKKFQLPLVEVDEKYNVENSHKCYYVCVFIWMVYLFGLTILK